MSEDIECAGCGSEIDTLEDTHYRVNEEERPVPSIKKTREELGIDDFSSRGWFLCRSCASDCIRSLSPAIDHDGGGDDV